MAFLTVGVKLKTRSLLAHEALVMCCQRNNDRLRRARVTAHHSGDLEPVQVGHGNVEKDNVWMPLEPGNNRNSTAIRSLGRKSKEAEVRGKGVGRVDVVIHDEDAR